MHKEDIGVARCLQKLTCDSEGCQHLDPFRDLVLFAHGSPDIAVDDIGAFKRFLISGNLDRCAGFRGDRFGRGENFRIDF